MLARTIIEKCESAMSHKWWLSDRSMDSKGQSEFMFLDDNDYPREEMTGADLMRIFTRVMRREYFRDYRKTHRGQMNEASRISMAKRRGTSVEKIDEKKEMMKHIALRVLTFTGAVQDLRTEKSGGRNESHRYQGNRLS